MLLQREHSNNYDEERKRTKITAVKFDTDFSYVAPVLLYVACSNHARTPRHMYSVRSLFTRSPVRVNRASHGKRYEKIRIKLNTVPLRSFHTYFGTLYRVAEPAALVIIIIRLLPRIAGRHSGMV